MTRREGVEPVDPRRLAAFEDRYGSGSYDRLLSLLHQPCVTFAEIADRFGVTRERVRQWQLLLLPDAPRGHERQRLCGIYRHKRRLLEDPLFRSFYRHARAHFPPGRIAFMQASDGFRRRAVRIDGRVVALKDTYLHARAKAEAPAWILARCATPAEFVYYRLTPNDYLFMPAHIVPSSGTTFSDDRHSRYRPYKNTFESFDGAPRSTLEAVSA
jgi:hypothetical protein